MSTFGTQTAYGVPILHTVKFNGVITGADQQLRVSDISNSSDPINNKRKISDLTVSFVDLGSSIWSGLGNGTGGFGTNIALTTFIGGTMGYTYTDTGTQYERQSLLGANSYTTHVGKIVNMSRTGRVTTIRSQNQMNLLPKLKWQNPVGSDVLAVTGSFHEKYSFVDITQTTAVIADFTANSGYNYSEDKTGWEFTGYPVSQSVSMDIFYQGTGLYDTTEGTGIEPFLASGYVFIDTPFTLAFESFKFKGTHFGRFFGTIDSEDKAKRYGYTNMAEAEANKTPATDGSFYDIDKIRYEWPKTADSTKPKVYPVQNMRFIGDPTAVLRHMLFGKMTTDYFLQANDEDTTSFDKAAGITAFQTYDQKVTAGENGKSTEPFVSDAVQTTNALFFVDTQNKFRFAPYGPLDFSQTIDNLGNDKVFSASFSNDINDWFNRIVFKYNWDPDTEEFGDTLGGTLASWTLAEDRPFEVESKWIKNGNQAIAYRNRMLSRFENTLPKIRFTTSLQEAGRELGSLVSITESETGMSAHKLQLVGYKKGFSTSKQIEFEALDGEALFAQRGYGIWEDGTAAGGTNIINSVVSGTSTFGWGTLYNGDAGTPFTGNNGTVDNINTAKYGTMWAWW